jgi:hypothetical protein
MEITAAQKERLTRQLAQSAGEPVLDLHVHHVTPLSMTVVFQTELGAYKAAYSFRDHAQSRTRVEQAKGPTFSGAWMFVMVPR